MTKTGITAASGAVSEGGALQARHWTSVAGAWLGIGTSPGALLLGAGIAARYDGPIPLISIVLSAVLMFTLLWFQGRLGLRQPYGDGGNLTEISPRYFGPLMQKLLGAFIAIGMTGWFGFNVGLGGAALSALLGAPHWVGALLLGLPIIALSLKGLKTWNGLAALTTLSVLVLVVLVVARLAAHRLPFTLVTGSPLQTITDIAVFAGYVSVFTVRAPDFTAGLAGPRDLAISGILLCLPVIAIALAGVGLQQGTGSTDLVGILASPGGLAAGNLLITFAVIAPTFTTFYSGVPALKAATGMAAIPAMILIAVAGLGLAILRFDLRLISWLGILAAILPPLVVPLAVESTMRRRGHPPRLLPIWLWLSGALVSLGLMALHNPLALLAGMATSGLATLAWYITLITIEPKV